MSLLNKLLQFIICISVVLLVYAMTFVGVFSSNQKITQVLDESGFYKSTAMSLSSSLKSQVVGSGDVVTIVQNGISSAVSPELVKSILQDSQISIIEWLNNSSQSIEIEIDLQPIKKSINSKLDDPKAKFEVSKILPDYLTIISKDKTDQNVLGQLDKARSIYATAVTLIPILWAVIIGGSVLVALLNIKKGSKKLSRVFTAFLAGSIIGLIVAGLTTILYSALGIGSPTSQTDFGVGMIGAIVATLISQTIPVFLVIAGASVFGIIISKVIFKRSDKKIKEKKR